MTSTDSPVTDQLIDAPTKIKRLPRSAKKRLRYEQLRQQRKQGSKTKVKNKKPSDSSNKLVKREGNERLTMLNQQDEGPTICIDCAYNESMSTKELASLARQIGRCYSSNRRAEKPVRLILTNWSNDNQLAEECRRVNAGFDQYPLIRNDQSIDQLYSTDRLVYLSPNGDQSLTEMSEDKIYVIGGLVDESVRKNMTYSSCQEKNIECYKLPIQLYMEHSMDGGTFNQILSINQVFDILLTYMSSNDWPQALKKNIPERKGWVIKQTTDDSTTDRNTST